MATIANDPLKERLMGEGLWADFVRMRHDLCEGEGLKSAEAAKRVLERIDPDAVELLKGRGRPGTARHAENMARKASEKADCGSQQKSEKQPKRKSMPKSPSQPKSIADARRENRDAKASSSAAVAVRQVGRYPQFAVTKETFAGKSCPYTVSLNWAYSNHRIDDIAPSDAPSAVAWNLLLDMRESPSIKADVLKGWSNAMARKAEVEEQNGDSFDGKAAYDLAGVIAKGGED